MNSVLMQLSAEHQALAETVREFANQVIAPVAAQHDREQTFPYEVVKEMARMGLFGLPFPEAVGGMGGDFLSLCLAIEELARIDQSVAITLEAAVGLASMPIFRSGTDEQKEEFLGPLISGEALGAFGLTEPDGGSDASQLRTTARLEGDEWVINGRLHYWRKERWNEGAQHNYCAERNAWIHGRSLLFKTWLACL
jgi:short/branched chain acyl-CoA dehydrogenase